MIQLDETDRRLLRLLQLEGRISNLDLAERCHLSPSACSDRVRRLRENNFITGYAAVLDPEKVGRALLIFVEVVLDRTTTDVFDAFAAAARRAPDILECHMVAGGFDYLMKVRVADMNAYRQFLGTGISRLPGVRETRTYVVIENVKTTSLLPTDPA